jgi:nitrite reductase/ring-hydroxylating ferredoxin subunit
LACIAAGGGVTRLHDEAGLTRGILARRGPKRPAEAIIKNGIYGPTTTPSQRPSSMERPMSTALAPPVLVMRDARRLREGDGVRFRILDHGLERDAFAVRYHGAVAAYLNTCRHQSLMLDFGDARFFDDAYDALVCCHHGARYEPGTGVCVAGPCVGSRLTRLGIEERDGGLWCTGRVGGDDAA